VVSGETETEGCRPWTKFLAHSWTAARAGPLALSLQRKSAEQLTAGRERIYLNRIWDDFAYHPERVTEAERARTAASYAQPASMHAGFSYFAGFDQDAKTPLTMPVLAVGGEKSFGTLMPQFAKAVATNVQASVIPDSGQWVMDENPSATTAALVRFLSGP